MIDLQGIEVLYWALSVLFCLALVFAILLWCRSWRKEEQEANLRHLQLLAREIRRLSEAVESLENTSSSLQTADEQLAQQVEKFRDIGRDLNRRLHAPPPAQAPRAPAEDEVPVIFAESSEDRYAQARDLLLAGQEPTDVARQLDLGTAEVRMIARLLEKTDDAS